MGDISLKTVAIQAKRFQPYINHPVFLLISGVVLGLSVSLPYFSLLGFVALIPLIALIYHNYSTKKLILLSGIFAVGFLGTVIFWLWSVFQLEWLGVTNIFVAYLMMGFVWGLSVAAMSTTIIGFVLVARKIRNNLLLISLVWVVFEYIRSLIFSLVWAGEGSILGSHWSFGFLGYAVADIPVLRLLAVIGGVYLLSFLVVFVNSLFYTIKEKGNIKYGVLLVLLLLSFVTYGTYGSPTHNASEPTVAGIFQTHFIYKEGAPTSEQYRERSRLFEEQLYTLANDQIYPDIIIFPESSEVFQNLPEDAYAAVVATFGAHNDTVFINPGNYLSETGERKSAIYHVFSRENKIETDEKVLLAPVGEYMPHIARFLASLFGGSEWLEETKRIREYAAGPSSGDNGVAGVLQCSEIFSPSLYAKSAAEHDLLINVASHGTFNDSVLLQEQIIKIARVRAIENSRYFIHSGNAAPAFVIDPRGSTTAFLESKDIGVLVADVYQRTIQTPYTLFINLLRD